MRQKIIEAGDGDEADLWESSPARLLDEPAGDAGRRIARRKFVNQ
jgi:hypothetical protein